MTDKPKNGAQYKMRVTHDRMEWLKRRAERNNRTINAEINFILGYFKMLEESGDVPKVG